VTRAKQAFLTAALALCALAGCSSSTQPATPAASTAATTAAAGDAAAATATGAGPGTGPGAGAGAGSAAAQAAAPKPAQQPTKGDADSSALESAAPLAGAGQLPNLKWVAGKNYVPLTPAQPTDSPPGKVEVIEVFWYACPHCYVLDPLLESWRKTKPDYIDFKRVPVTWQEMHRAHAHLFYTLSALGKEDALHKDVFELMHSDQGHQGNLLFLQGNAQETFSTMQQYAKSKGIAEGDFAGAWNSFTVQSNLSRADDIVRRFRIDGVPSILINGKYMTDEGMAGGPANVINIINDLAASERPH
jgi:thiol:disulfide interchange protein DsbA